jgi:hypothetical protein
VRSESGQVSAISPSAYATGAWHHAFCAFSSSTTCEVWLDGGGYFASDMIVPSGMSVTQIGGLNDGAEDGGAQTSFDGELAEAAIWFGGGVDEMASQAVPMLAAGFSPLCVSPWRSNLVLYQDLIRQPNRPGIGAHLAAAGGPAAAAHPRIALARTAPGIGFRPHVFAPPFRLRRGAGCIAGADAAAAAASGVQAGELYSFGEVSS